MWPLVTTLWWHVKQSSACSSSTTSLRRPWKSRDTNSSTSRYVYSLQTCKTKILVSEYVYFWKTNDILLWAKLHFLLCSLIEINIYLVQKVENNPYPSFQLQGWCQLGCCLFLPSRHSNRYFTLFGLILVILEHPGYPGDHHLPDLHHLQHLPIPGCNWQTQRSSGQTQRVPWLWVPQFLADTVQLGNCNHCFLGLG